MNDETSLNKNIATKYTNMYKVKQSKEYGGKTFLIYSLGDNDFMIYQKNEPEAKFSDDRTQIENSAKSSSAEELIDNTHYPTVGEAEKALLEHVGVVELDWI